MLTGRPPFKGANTVETLEQVRSVEPVSPRRLQPRVPRDLDTICLKCLEKAPAKRYARSSELAEDLRRFLDGRPIVARPVGPVGRAWRWCKRRPLPASLIGACTLALLVFTVFMLTRPAYLEVRIKPFTATATLDGEPLQLDKNGEALVSRGPGEYLLEASAEGYLPRQQKVRLVRGRDNALVASLELSSVFGDLEVTTTPEGANVQILDDAGRVVDEGATPFRSKRLRGGEYRLQVRKELYQEKVMLVTVPSGNERVTVPPVTLTIIDGATESMRLIALQRRLEEAWKGTHEFDDPRLSLKEVLEYVAALTQLRIAVDEKAFKDEDPDAPDILETEIAQTPLRFGARGDRIALGEVLTRVLNRVRRTVGVELVPIKQGGDYALELTTRNAAESRRFSILHPVGELLTGPKAMAPEDLIAAVRGQLLPAESADADIRYLAAGSVVHVRHNWRVQRQIEGYLTQLRQGRRVGGDGPATEKKPRPTTARDDPDRAQAEKHMDKGEWKQAKECLKRVLGRFPGDEPTLALLGDTHTFLGEWKELSDLASSVLSRDPGDVTFLVMRASARLQLGEYEGSAEDLGALDWSTVTDLESTFHYAGVLALADQRGTLRGLCGRWVKLGPSPGDVRGHYLIGLMCVLVPDVVKDYTPVRALIERALKDKPKSGPYLHAAGMVELRAGRLAEAEKRFLESLDRAPTWSGQVNNWLGLALVYQRQNNAAEAKKWLAKATEWSASDKSEQSPMDPHDWLVAIILHKEAEAAIRP
jgi:tetratricopeptide (TPR) repeat protein